MLALTAVQRVDRAFTVFLEKDTSRVNRTSISTTFVIPWRRGDLISDGSFHFYFFPTKNCYGNLQLGRNNREELYNIAPSLPTELRRSLWMD